MIGAYRLDERHLSVIVTNLVNFLGYKGFLCHLVLQYYSHTRKTLLKFDMCDRGT